MSNEFTFWYGQVASGHGNGFCLCGEPVDRARRYAVHCWDGRVMRQVCAQCNVKFAPSLAKLCGVEREPIHITDLLADHDASRWELSPVVECDVVEIDDQWFDDATLDDDAETDGSLVTLPTDEPTPPTWARHAVVDPDAECATGACGPVV